jgi:hypothetical protein
MRSSLLALLFLPMLAAAPAPPKGPGTLVLYNARWDSVQVEVSIGTSIQCVDNASVGTRTLRRNQRWAVVSGSVICWRREVVPGNSGRGWTAWDQDRLTSAEVREVTL